MDIALNAIDLFLVAPLICLFLGSLIPITVKVLRGNKEMAPFPTIIYGFIGIVLATGFLIAAQSVNTLAFSGALVYDGITIFTSLVVLLITAVTLLYSGENSAICKEQFSEYVFLLLGSAIGMLIVVASNDLIVTFIGIEIMSLCLYMLIALGRDPILSKEAALKYFILGSFASAIFLYGIALVYGSVGSTYLGDIAKVASLLMSSHRIFVFGAVMVILGFGFKLALVPFHSWAPDVYQGSPTPLTGFMATGVKIVVFMAFLRWLLTDILVGDRSVILLNVLEWSAVLTMVVGNVAAIMQDSLKRMLAYSGIAHSGYAMMGLLAAAVGSVEGGIFGASGLLFYVFSYTIMTLGAFGVVSLLEVRENKVFSIENDLKGLGKNRPWLALGITLFMLSLAGIPPTLGFFGKFFLFSAALKQGFFWLVIWGVISSVISVYYYLRPVVFMYMVRETEERDVRKNEQAPDSSNEKLMTQTCICLSAVFVVVAGMTLDPIYKYIQEIVSRMF